MGIHNGYSEQARSSIHRLFLLSIFVWTLLLACLLTWNIQSVIHQTTELASHAARAFFDEVVTTRAWNNSHGGVYVPVSDTTQPNQYLHMPDRDVTTTSGVLLTKLNPSFMNRQIGELAAQRNNVWYHITSKKPIRPDNAPDPWEVEAMTMFENGVEEHFEFIDALGGGKNFRYMAPLWVEEE